MQNVNNHKSILPIYREHGWVKFEHDCAIENWAHWVLPFAEATLLDDEFEHWWRYQRTWFVGVNVLDNNSRGVIAKGPALSGNCIDFMRDALDFTVCNLDQGQVSAIFAGYPKPIKDEDEPGFAYRQKRDAAHMDGLLKIGQNGERFALEYHQYILAIPLNDVSELASPLSVWSGSHRIMRTQLQRFYNSVPKSEWSTTPVNSVYETARRQVFSECQRVELPMRVGEVLLIDRHLIHGTSIWRSPLGQDLQGRLIVFFRPQIKSMVNWLEG